jgi:hypothetical protein
MNEQPDAEQVLDGIGEALEARGYSHMTNGKSIGNLLDELEALRAQSDAAEAIAAEIREKPEFKEMVAQAHALAQSDAEPKGIDLDDVDRAYDKWAEHRNGQSRLDAFRAGVEFGLRHTALAQSDASAGLIEEATQARNILAGLPNLKGDAFTAWRILTDALRAADRSA